MKNFKRLLTFAFALVIAFLLSGCELVQAGQAVIPKGGYDGSEVTIKFYHTMSATTLQPTLETYIAEFNKIYPNIHIVHEQVGG